MFVTFSKSKMVTNIYRKCNVFLSGFFGFFRTFSFLPSDIFVPLAIQTWDLYEGVKAFVVIAPFSPKTCECEQIAAKCFWARIQPTLNSWIILVFAKHYLLNGDGFGKTLLIFLGCEYQIRLLHFIKRMQKPFNLILSFHLK